MTSRMISKAAVACSCLVFLLLAIQPVLAFADHIELRPIGWFRHGEVWDGGAAEILDYSPEAKRLFVVNGELKSIDILDISDPAAPKLFRRVDISRYGAAANSLSVHAGLLAVAIQAEPITDQGCVAFFDLDGGFLGAKQAGSLPDMVTFTPNGKFVLVANEGEPNDDYSVDPEGSITIVELGNPRWDLSKATSRHAMFSAPGEQNRPEIDRPMTPAGIRITGPNATFAQDLEPEYITVSANSRTAWVTLQENNALAIVDIQTATISKVVGLGTQQHQAEQQTFDASDQDDRISFRNWPVQSFFQPDSIASFTARPKVDGKPRTFLITANEGDTRGYGDFVETARVAELKLDESAFPDAEELQRPDRLGRLVVSRVEGDTDGDGSFESLYDFGGRSFAIWDVNGQLVYDSGNMLERSIAEDFPDQFNSDHSAETYDTRSDDRGPEPEGLAVGEVAGRNIAFVGLERFSGIAVVDIDDVKHPRLLSLFKEHPTAAREIPDQAPEGLHFISAADSPNGRPLLAVSYEVSGTTRIYEVVIESDRVSGLKCRGLNSPIRGGAVRR